MIVSNCLRLTPGVLVDHLTCSELSTVMRSTKVVRRVLEVLVLQVLAVDRVNIRAIVVLSLFFLTFFSFSLRIFVIGLVLGLNR